VSENGEHMNTVVISGVIANKPFNGGAAWTRLNYVLGLRKLGFDVFFVEQIKPETFQDANILSYFQRVMDDFNLTGKAVLVSEDGQHCEGLSRQRLLEVADAASLLINISGHLTVPAIKDRIRRRAFIDLDPGFTQLWHASGAPSRVEGHDSYFTIGENIPSNPLLFPGNGIRWRPTRQPVVLELWPVCVEGRRDRFTTVASWRGPYGPVEYAGRRFGSKVHQFRKYATMPIKVDSPFEIALDIHPADYRDREMLCRNSWRLVDPKIVAAEPASFREYVQTSGAEFSVAQEMYVATGSGWFSDRSVRYLASGKPVLVEDTGFSRNYPVGDGLLTFATQQQAIAGAHDIIANYPAHSCAARQIAEEYFDSNRVLTQLLDDTGLCT
jgi:hypothetical protein